MGLNRKPKPLFTQAWVDGLKAIPEAGMAAEFKIFTEDLGAWDSATDSYPNRTETVFYNGKARVQPLRTAVRRTTPGNDTTVQPVLVSIPIGTNVIDFRRGMWGRVTEAPLNPALKDVEYVL